jgi:AcrR family transcriptional regulator
MKAAKSTYHHGDLSHELVSRGLEALEEKGPDGLSLRELARAAGVSPNAPYRHFPSKEDLLLELIRHGFEDLASALQEECNGGPDELERMGDAYTRFALERPHLFRLMFSGRLPANPGESFRAMVILGEAVRRRLPEGADDLSIVKSALGAWTLVHGAAVLQVEGMVAWADPKLLAMTSLRDSVAELGHGVGRI